MFQIACNSIVAYFIVISVSAMALASAEPPAEQDMAMLMPASFFEEGDDQSHQSLVEELEAEVSATDMQRYITKEGLEDIENEMQPTFVAVPKNEYGNLGTTSARYVVHRFFVAKHAWSIQGVDPAGDNFNKSSPVAVLAHKVPERVQAIFEKRLIGRGFTLRDVATFAATLELFIKQEAAERVMGVLQGTKTAVPAENMRGLRIPMSRALRVINLYMAAYILGKDVQQLDAGQMRSLLRQMPEMYPGWETTKAFIKKTAESFAGETGTGLTYATLLKVVNEISGRYGKFQNQECRVMKEKLMKLEASDEGCVPLSNFYGSNLGEGNWQFAESSDYLRQLGAMDLSDAGNPRVIVANYVNGQSNCVASSGYYSVCCIDECLDLMAQIERHVQGPDASPEELRYFVAGLATSSMQGPGTLTPAQIRKLESIGRRSETGRVPIHGRLFAQWLHWVFPRECQYPHLTGTTKPISVYALKEDYTLATKEEMRKAVNASHLQHSEGQCGAWLEQEELYAYFPTRMPVRLSELEKDASLWATASSLAMLTVMAVMLLMVMNTFKTLKAAAAKCHAALPQPKLFQV